MELKKIMSFQNPQTKKVQISTDDPFASIFIEKGSKDIRIQEGQREDTAEDLNAICDPDLKYEWRNSQYWALPENVRNAIDVAQMKKKHSNFYYRLRLLNDKIAVFTSIFYNNVPKYQQKWYQQKQKMLQEQLQREKFQFQ